MPRPYPNRRRRRPHRRSPKRYSGGPGPPELGGFTPLGLRGAYNVFLPALRGGEKRRWFNGLCRSLLLSSGLTGATIGYAWAGPIGAVFGFCGGLMAGGSLAEQQRFYRR